MKRTVLMGTMVILIGAAADATSPADAKSDKKVPPPYVHCVVFHMKKDAAKDAVAKAIADCHYLLGEIPAVRSLRVGRPATKGTPDVPKMEYDFALLILVDDADGLEAYLKHPLHLQFVKRHGPAFDMEKLQVFDFVNQTK